MQQVVGRRAQQQRQAVTTVAADHDQVTALFLGHAVDFLARLAVGQHAIAGQLRILGSETVQSLAGLLDLLLLQRRQVHGHVTAKGHGHGLDHVHQRHLAATALTQGHGATDHRLAIFGQVDGNQYVLVGHTHLSFMMGRQTVPWLALDSQALAHL